MGDISVNIDWLKPEITTKNMYTNYKKKFYYVSEDHSATTPGKQHPVLNAIYQGTCNSSYEGP